MDVVKKIEKFEEKLLVSLYDKLAENYSPPAICRNKAVAQRMFKHTIEKMEADMDEYELVIVGVFDEKTGEIQPVNAKIQKMEEKIDAPIPNSSDE